MIVNKHNLEIISVCQPPYNALKTTGNATIATDGTLLVSVSAVEPDASEPAYVSEPVASMALMFAGEDSFSLVLPNIKPEKRFDEKFLAARMGHPEVTFALRLDQLREILDIADRFSPENGPVKVEIYAKGFARLKAKNAEKQTLEMIVATVTGKPIADWFGK